MKRYFRFDDGARFWVVANDQPHAVAILDATGSEFGGLGTMTAALAAGGVFWIEMDTESAANTMCDTSEDNRARGRIPLTDCDVGEWFSSEW